MPYIHYDSSPDDACEPTGVVLRTLNDGRIDATVAEGGDETVVLVTRLIVNAVAQLGKDRFLAQIRLAAEHAGLDPDEMIEEAEEEGDGAG